MTPILYLKNDDGTFDRCPDHFSDYSAAVRYGQQTAGHGRFYVETGAHVPSRQQQLLEETDAERRSRLLEQI